MTLTKADIIEEIHKNCGFTKSKSADLTESIFEIIKHSLESGQAVLISGFGKFYVKEKRERRGRNPVTGEDLMLGPRRVAIFKCSGVLRAVWKRPLRTNPQSIFIDDPSPQIVSSKLVSRHPHFIHYRFE